MVNTKSIILALVLPSIVPNYHLASVERHIYKVPLKKAEQVTLNPFDTDNILDISDMPRDISSTSNISKQLFARIDKVIVVPNDFKYNKIIV